jgi:sugar O-acyltransferase (sialic acid O-acetyltransferase NeuD family)
MAKVVIWGTKDLSQLAHFYLTCDSKHEVVAFTVDRAYIEQETFQDLPVIAFEDLEKHYPPSDYRLFFPISPAKMNSIRKNKYLAGKSRGYQFISYISSKATYYNTPVGENCFIFENNVIQPFTSIGNNVILWSGNHIGHHSQIEDHCFITSHVVISGHVNIKNNVFIGVNATIRDDVTLAPYSLIGASAFINENTIENGVYPGSNTLLKKTQSVSWDPD